MNFFSHVLAQLLWLPKAFSELLGLLLMTQWAAVQGAFFMGPRCIFPTAHFPAKIGCSE
jgi:hypothetical protein